MGWNHVEYEALGQSFHTRGKRFDEQIPLLRRLFTETAVTHAGPFDQITAAGLAPPPVQRPIPIWIGGQSPSACRRIGRLADGWFPQVRPGEPLVEALALVAEGAETAGRDPAAIAMEGRVNWTDDGVAKLVDHVGRWQAAGASQLSVNTMGTGLTTVAEHLEVLAFTAEAVQPIVDRPS